MMDSKEKIINAFLIWLKSKDPNSNQPEIDGAKFAEHSINMVRDFNDLLSGAWDYNTASDVLDIIFSSIVDKTLEMINQEKPMVKINVGEDSSTYKFKDFKIVVSRDSGPNDGLDEYLEKAGFKILYK